MTKRIKLSEHGCIILSLFNVFVIDYPVIESVYSKLHGLPNLTETKRETLLPAHNTKNENGDQIQNRNCAICRAMI